MRSHCRPVAWPLEVGARFLGFGCASVRCVTLCPLLTSLALHWLRYKKGLEAELLEVLFHSCSDLKCFLCISLRIFSLPFRMNLLP